MCRNCGRVEDVAGKDGDGERSNGWDRKTLQSPTGMKMWKSAGRIGRSLSMFAGSWSSGVKQSER